MDKDSWTDAHIQIGALYLVGASHDWRFNKHHILTTFFALRVLSFIHNPLLTVACIHLFPDRKSLVEGSKSYLNLFVKKFLELWNNTFIPEFSEISKTQYSSAFARPLP